jgi:hypothetical protein
MTIRYYVIGVVPVKYIYDPEKGCMTAKKYDSATGCFVEGEEYLADISFRIDDVEEVSKEKFIRQLEELRAREFKAEGELTVLYDEIRNAIYTIRREGRRSTLAERQHIMDLCQKSYQLFESTIGCDFCGHNEYFD